MNSSVRDALAESLVNSYPSNINSMIPVPLDSSGIYNYLDQMYPFANFTCKYTTKTATETFTKITYGVFSSFPFTSKSKNLFLCQSPMWEVTGATKIQISMNGYDFSTKDLSISFTDPINVIKVEPKCGPLNGGTIVDFYGTGFDKKKEFVFKWGPQNLVPMESASFLDFINESNKSSFKLTPQDIQKVNPQFKIEKIQVKSPEAPFYQLTSGGVDYLAITKLNYFPSESYENKFSPSLYLHTKHEFYYYRQPYIQSFLPRGTVINGGAVVTVVGAWFEYLPEYGVKPYCKFGDKIVEGTYLNTVRITCVAPVYDTPNVRVNLCVSLNKFDWTCADQQFTFYNDFTKAKFDKMVPQSGPETGGTQIKIFGQNFTNLASPEEFVCKFQPEAGSEMPAKIVPAGYQEFTKTNQTAIICNSPGGWTSGTKANILISFDGQNFINTGFNFYFYKIDLIKPKSGPNLGGGSIGVYGGGFKNSSKVRCDINEVSYSPSSMNEHLIQCPLPPAPNKNYTGFIDLGIVLNGIDQKLFPKGFYYYKQISVDSIYPPNGPNSGNAKVKVYGKGFRNDFPGIDLGCKVGNNYGKGEYVSSNEMNCYFNRLPLLSAGNSTMNLSVALNNYSFTEETAKLSFTPYGIIQISPSSGPIIGNTRIEIRGAGFFDSKKIRCRFGVPGYYFYTQAEYINSNLIVCNSPEDFKVPIAGQLPFSVPLSIAFNDDEFQPWTESGHFFSFYEEYKIVGLTPLEGSTKTTTEIKVFASEEKPFSLPSASNVEEDLVDFSKSAEGKIVSKKSFIYQPISCRFGRFGSTVGQYVNRTIIKCLTPNVGDDSDVAYEEIPVEIALNGVDYFSSDDVIFTFVGPNAGKMLWVYILITVFTAILIIGIVAFVSSYWNKIIVQSNESRRNLQSGDQPHVVNKQPRYLDPFLRGDAASLNDSDSQIGRRLRLDEENNNRRNIGGSMV